MDESWDSNVSPLMMGVGLSLGELQQQSTSSHGLHQDMHQVQQRGEQQHPQELGGGAGDMQQVQARGGHMEPDIGGEDGYHGGGLGHHHDFYSNQLLVSGQPTTLNPHHPGSSPGSITGGGGVGTGSLSPGGSATGGVGALSPGGTSSSGGGGTTTTPGITGTTAGGPGTPTASAGGGGAPCCESGRPLVTDPVTGQSVCSCQYDQASRLAALQYPRGVGVYGTPYPSTDQNPYPSIGVESSAFYSPLGNPYGLKDGGGATDMSAWTSAGLQPTTGYYPYDPALAAYGYGAGYDLAARRKNATRESTATLKAWLNEHKKNPYPTKGEKIMLAIITKMTLTQVSTWFANARRRLKKENKMTWEPKNKTDDDDDALISDSDDKDKDDDDKRDDDVHSGRIKSERTSGKDLDDDDMTDDDRKDDHHHLQLVGSHMHHILAGSTFNHHLKSELKSSTTPDCGVPLPPSKPKIWSLADTAACKTPPPPPPAISHPHSHYQHQYQQQYQHHQQQVQQQQQQQAQQHWLTSGGSNGFALPSSRYGSGNFLSNSSHCHQGGGGGGGGGQSGGFPSDVQTDTPPQTPPSMKLPPSNNNNNCGSAGYGQGGFLGGFSGSAGRLQASPTTQHTSRPGLPSSGSTGGQMTGSGSSGDSAAAFKPFYKTPSSMNGGFVSPV